MMTQDAHEVASREHRTVQTAIHQLVARNRELEAGQRALLDEFEAMANQLGPLSSQRVRAWAAARRERLQQPQRAGEGEP